MDESSQCKKISKLDIAKLKGKEVSTKTTESLKEDTSQTRLPRCCSSVPETNSESETTEDPLAVPNAQYQVWVDYMTEILEKYRHF